MSPLTLKLLLDVHTSPKCPELKSEAHRESFEWLRAEKMVEIGQAAGSKLEWCDWQLTSRGAAFVNHILMLPLPVAFWTVQSPAAVPFEAK